MPKKINIGPGQSTEDHQVVSGQEISAELSQSRPRPSRAELASILALERHMPLLCFESLLDQQVLSDKARLLKADQSSKFGSLLL